MTKTFFISFLRRTVSVPFSILSSIFTSHCSTDIRRIIWKCLELVHGIAQEFGQLQNDSNHLIRSLLYQLLVILNRYYACIHNVQRDTYIHADFYRFRSLLEKKFVDDRSVDAYSKVLNISTGFLNKICRQFSGLSAQQMIHYKLISEIKTTLSKQICKRNCLWIWIFRSV